MRTALFEIIQLARTGRACYLLICSMLIVSQPLSGYSVLSHEEVIDLMWDSDLRPALLKRFPNATPEELKKAHAFAYGGSVIQDVGYYPLGNHKFTDMLHYVRTGDFLAVPHGGDGHRSCRHEPGRRRRQDDRRQMLQHQ